MLFNGGGGGDRFGPLLDNVRIGVTAVPEPGTWAQMILGFGLVGAVLRGARRRRPAVA